MLKDCMRALGPHRACFKSGSVTCFYLSRPEFLHLFCCDFSQRVTTRMNLVIYVKALSLLYKKCINELFF